MKPLKYTAFLTIFLATVATASEPAKEQSVSEHMKAPVYATVALLSAINLNLATQNSCCYHCPIYWYTRLNHTYFIYHNAKKIYQEYQKTPSDETTTPESPSTFSKACSYIASGTLGILNIPASLLRTFSAFHSCHHCTKSLTERLLFAHDACVLAFNTKECFDTILELRSS